MLERNASRERMDLSSNSSAHMGREAGFDAPVLVLLAVVMLLLIGVIVLGNALVILAFKTDRSLRRQSNYFLLNLAISDFLVEMMKKIEDIKRKNLDGSRTKLEQLLHDGA